MLCGAASDASSGSPRLTHLPAVPAMEPSSYLDLASFGGTLRRRSELPRFFALSVPPPDSRLRVSPSPQVFRLPAMPLRVSPIRILLALLPASLRVAPSLRPYRLSMSFQVSLVTASSGCASGNSAGRPASSLPLRRRLVEFRVTPDSAPFGLPAVEGPGRPASSLPPALPLPRLRVSPFPASTAGR